MKKKLISAAIRLAFGLVAFAVVSYWWFSDAWFAQSNRVQTEGVELSAVVPLNIYISGSDDEQLSQSMTFPMANLEQLGFGNMYEYEQNVVLRPSSSSDGSAFWYAKKVNSEGIAIQDVASQSTYSLVEQDDLAYYMEKTIYLAATTEAYDDVTSLDCYVSNVTIEGLSLNQLYKAARISISAVDDSENETTVIYRYAADITDTEGKALPVVDAHNKSLTDPSVAMGTYEFMSSGALPINLVCAQQGIISVKEVIVRVWFEGENAFAIRSLAGGGFSFEIEFTLVDPATGE
ncbi:MAG: hypothetical protein PHY13_02785 [Clostridia bacterium]|nr:hypothetical protein [Clostridia bacterium]